LHLAILRSPLAHARIVGVDTSAALREPGVIDVFQRAATWPTSRAACRVPGR